MIQFAQYYLRGGKLTGLIDRGETQFLAREDDEPFQLPSNVRAVYVPTKYIHWRDKQAPDDEEELTLVVGPTNEIDQLSSMLRAVSAADDSVVNYLEQVL